MSEDIFGIGELSWNNSRQRWCGLVNFFGSLCIAEFRVTTDKVESPVLSKIS